MVTADHGQYWPLIEINISDGNSQACCQLSLPHEIRLNTSDVWDSKHRPASHCRVLPPGEFNGIILEPLAVIQDKDMT